MLQGSAVGGKVAPFLTSFNGNRKGVKKGEEAIKFHGSTDNVPQNLEESSFQSVSTDITYFLAVP